jgi:hypothetical protein
MGRKADGSVVKTIEATFSLVVKANKGIDIGDMLRNETSWLGEPESPSGFVMAMQLKEICEVNSGKKKVI